jgi:hypothetical protein
MPECKDCKSTVEVVEYDMTDFATFPGTTLRRLFCVPCKDGHERRGYKLTEVTHAS